MRFPSSRIFQAGVNVFRKAVAPIKSYFHFQQTCRSRYTQVFLEFLIQ